MISRAGEKDLGSGMSFLSQAFPTDATHEEHVGVLMAVYNGSRFLRDQLDSLEAQEHRNWTLLASDDGSTDDSPEILASFRTGNRVTRLEGPNEGNLRSLEGVARNFLSLLRAAPDHLPPGSWLSLADQDDVWLDDRLTRGIAALLPLGREQPALYCSRTWITDSWLSSQRLSPPRPRPPSFRNALVQNIAAGNTILLNPAAARLVIDAAARVDEVVVHDWWIYQLVTGAGGHVVYDDKPTLLYRQHDRNVIGANDSTLARLKRIAWLLRGEFRALNEINIRALAASAGQLTAENRELLAEFEKMRRLSPISQFRALRHLGLYRQSRLGDLALRFAVLLRRM